MREKVIKIPIHGKALCIFSDGNLLCYRGGVFRLYDAKSYAVIKKFKLPNKKFCNVLSRWRILERLLHCEARWAVPIDDDTALVCMSTGIFRVNCRTGEYTRESVPVQGRPLSATVLRDINGFDDSVIIGDYNLNPERNPVSLYQRNSNGEWRCAYTFPAGMVRHIHGVFADRDAQKVYILTGDEDAESGIWIAENNFDAVKPLLVGSQQYRACQMIAAHGHILYMTDAPSEKNAIYRVNDGCAERFADLEGTCIYGSGSNSTGVFSTTCEPDAHAKNRVEYWLSSKPGKGICGRTISVFILRADGTRETVAQFEHDGLPLRLFQYGTVTFTNVQNGCVYFTPHCVKNNAEQVFKLIL